MIQTQVINLVIGVVSCPSRITHATSDRAGSCGAKLLNGFNVNTSGRPAYLASAHHPPTQTKSRPMTSLFLESLPRRGGGWFANTALEPAIAMAGGASREPDL